jgi:hypothetical protein
VLPCRGREVVDVESSIEVLCFVHQAAGEVAGCLDVKRAPFKVGAPQNHTGRTGDLLVCAWNRQTSLAAGLVTDEAGQRLDLRIEHVAKMPVTVFVGEVVDEQPASTSTWFAASPQPSAIHMVVNMSSMSAAHRSAPNSRTALQGRCRIASPYSVIRRGEPRRTSSVSSGSRRAGRPFMVTRCATLC